MSLFERSVDTIESGEKSKMMNEMGEYYDNSELPTDSATKEIEMMLKDVNSLLKEN